MAGNNKSGTVLGKLKDTKIIWLGVAILILAVFAGMVYTLKSVYQTETYYVLNQDVPTRTQINMDMLTPIVTSEGTAPGGTPDMTAAQRASEREAILTAVQSGAAYSQFPLVSGDVLSPSNVGVLSDISIGVPDSWVITSFSVDYNNAVQGRIQRGTYFDMMMVADTGAYYPFVNVLALETATGGGTASAEGQDVSGMNATTSVYTVGMTPENAAKLQWLSSFGAGSMKLVLSPRANEYQAPNLIDYEGTFFYDPMVDGVIAPGLQPVLDADGKPVDVNGDGVADVREVTDYTFSDVERDSFGRPVSRPDNAGLGNAKIPADSVDGENAIANSEEGSNAGTTTGGGSDSGTNTAQPEDTARPDDDATVDEEDSESGSQTPSPSPTETADN